MLEGTNCLDSFVLFSIFISGIITVKDSDEFLDIVEKSRALLYPYYSTFKENILARMISLTISSGSSVPTESLIVLSVIRRLCLSSGNIKIEGSGVPTQPELNSAGFSVSMRDGSNDFSSEYNLE